MSTTGRLRANVPASSPDERARGLAELLGARVHIDVTIPRTTIRGRMRLVSRSERAAIHGEMRSGSVALGAPDAVAEHLAERAVRHLAMAVRDPADESKPLAELAEWRECDDDQIGAMWVEYNDLAARLDPIGADAELSVEDITALRAASKKKDMDSLMSFGSRKLAIFATTSDEPPPT